MGHQQESQLLRILCEAMNLTQGPAARDSGAGYSGADSRLFHGKRYQRQGSLHKCERVSRVCCHKGRQGQFGVTGQGAERLLSSS